MSYPPGLAMGGDIDEETYCALIEALFKVTGNTAGVHIDLSAVNFCDLAGLHSIIRLSDATLPVILHGVPAPLRTVMRVLGWDDTPGLVISKRQHRHSCAARPPGRPAWQGRGPDDIPAWPRAQTCRRRPAWRAGHTAR